MYFYIKWKEWTLFSHFDNCRLTTICCTIVLREGVKPNYHSLPFLEELVFSISIYIFIEICAVSKVSKKEIGRCFKLTLRALETSVDLITSGDFMVHLVVILFIICLERILRRVPFTFELSSQWQCVPNCIPECAPIEPER
jgi:hypothetical protein